MSDPSSTAKTDGNQDHVSDSERKPQNFSMSSRVPGDGQEAAEPKPTQSQSQPQSQTPSQSQSQAAKPSEEDSAVRVDISIPSWNPRPDLIEAVTSIGFSRNIAEKALLFTGNNSADAAVSWILEHPEVEDRPLEADEIASFARGLTISGGAEFDEDDILASMPSFKMVFVVNNELKMGLGKIAAQIAHATLGLYRSLLETGPAWQESLVQWDMKGETKVVVRGESTEHLKQLAEQANALKIPHYVVHDAGRTQIAAGSLTVLSLFHKEDIVDQVTGKLKLL